MNTSPETFVVTVPRQPFSGWFVSVKAFWQAGLSDVIFTFSKGELLLLSYWGDIRIPYEGSFQGRVTITAQRLLTLANKGEEMMSQPIPIQIKLHPVKRRMEVDFWEVPAQIEVGEPQETPKPDTTTRPHAVGIQVTAGELLQLVRAAAPGRTGKKDHLKFIASAAGLKAQSPKGTAEQPFFVVGGGEWTVSLPMMIQALETYAPRTPLTVEADSKEMRLNAFKMPVLSWTSTRG
jgi:hypothetical protein